jgi:guanylate kinase
MDVASYIFVAPPSIDALRARLEARGEDTPASVARRLRDAAGEIETARGMAFDSWIVNGELEAAYAALKVAVEATRCDCARARGAAVAGAK